MSPQTFGRGGPWKKKETIGGTIYYIDAAISADVGTISGWSFGEGVLTATLA